MCGIAGIAVLGEAPAPTLPLIQRMCDTMVYRGPDDQGLEVRDGVGLGMRRLSIIDVAGGGQPIFNEDRSVRTVFNGEIYNFRELRKELEVRGHRFATRTDTEVLVHGYEEYGSELPVRLNGMFAFAIHDLRERRLLLARDHVGIKPLYYAVTPDYLVWGSEIKVLLASGLISRELDLDSLAEFLTWEYVPAPGTLLRDVRKLEAGHLLEIELGTDRRRKREYWDLPCGQTELRMNERDWADAADQQLSRSVRRQLVSDVPLGAFLSGGVDSSLLVSAMGEGTRTFSIGFDDASYDEVRFARKVADRLGLDHRHQRISPTVIDLFDRLMHSLDDPIGDFSIFPTYLVSRLAREEVTVALSGDGGDEIFGGYETYVAQQRVALYERLPGWARRALVEPLVRALPPREQKKGLVNKLKRFVEGAALPPRISHARWRMFLAAELRGRLLSAETRAGIQRDPLAHVERAFQRADGYGPLTSSLYVDFKTYLADNILVKADRMSMATSLEVRVPFLDHELVELAFRMPDELKVEKGRTKVLLKRVAARHVPRECVYRPKEGFSIPIKNWLGTQFRPVMEQLLGFDRLRTQGLIDPGVVETLKHEHLAGAANHSHLLWSLIVFQAWHREWLEGA